MKHGMKRTDLMGAEIQELIPLHNQVYDSDESADGEDRPPEAEDVQQIVKRAIEEAVMHFEEHIEPDMALATDYYYGRPFGDEVMGRSQVVSTDVRDATLDQIPELLEIYMGSDSVVEFKPRFPEDVAGAEQATDMVNYVFFEDNDGFLILNAVFKDGGVRRVGYTKWRWQEQDRVTGTTMSGLTEEELQYLSQQDGVEFEIVGQSEDTIQQPNAETGAMESIPIQVYSVEVKRTITDGRVRVEEVPPEEIVFTPEARRFGTAPMIAHRREVAVEELILLGIDEDFIEEHMGVQQALSNSTESLPWARQFYGSSSASEIVREARDYMDSDPSQKKVLFTEAYGLVDTDGDKVGELRMFQCVGPDYEIWNGEGMGELVDEVPIAAFTPDPEPHTVLGLCNFDYLREIQKVKSQIQRGQLNSLAQSIENQLIVTREVNIRDIVSPEISGIIRVARDVNAVREIKHQFVGNDTLPVLAYYDQIRADRTGRKGPGEGMDPNIMQSTTAEAVSSTLSRGQQRIKMLARVYAETGFKPMFKGIYGLLIKHQRRERMVKLRNQYVQVNPAYWDAEMDVRVNVALGTGSRTEKISALQMLAEKQEMHLAQGSPLISFAEIRKTYGKLTDLLGYKDTDQFWRPWGPEQQQQFEQQKAEAAKTADKDAQQRIVDVEELKVQLAAMNDSKSNELKELDIRLKHERETDKMAREYALREFEIELQYKASINDIDLKHMIAEYKKPTA